MIRMKRTVHFIWMIWIVIWQPPFYAPFQIEWMIFARIEKFDIATDTHTQSELGYQSKHI